MSCTDLCIDCVLSLIGCNRNLLIIENGAKSVFSTFSVIEIFVDCSKNEYRFSKFSYAATAHLKPS